MKYILLIPDGAADRPIPELGNKTCLQAAKKPNLDRLAREGQTGLALTCPEGTVPGSDTAIMSLVGYDPRVHFTGRAPLEAVSMSIDLKPNQTAFRCNLVTVKDGVMVDYSAGHISTGEAKLLIEKINKVFGTKKIKFYPGVGYRHLMVVEGATVSEAMKTTPPHDIMGQPIEKFLPSGKGETVIRQLMADSVLVLDGHEVNWRRRSEKVNTANMIWLWGCGKKPKLPSMTERFKIAGGVISAVDLVNGIGVCAGLDVIKVPGITGYLDTHFAGKAEFALKALKKKDLVLIHVEAPDEAGHNGDAAAKVQAIEHIDEKLLGPLLEGMKKFGDFRILVAVDHPTPVSLRTHTADRVPVILYGAGIAPDATQVWDEDAARAGALQTEQGWTLMEMLIGSRQS